MKNIKLTLISVAFLLKKIKKITCLFMLLFLLGESKSIAQKLIPFQYQSQKEWNNNALWGYMNEDKKIIFKPFAATYTPKVIDGKYINSFEGIKNITTGKIMIDSVDAKNIAEIKANLCSVSDPKKSGYYKTRTIKNIITKKVLSTDAEFSSIPNFIITKDRDDDFMHSEGVIDENGKQIVPNNYAKIKANGFGFFIAEDYADYYIFNTKGEMLNKLPYSYIDNNNDRNSIKKYTKAERTLKGTPSKYEFLFLDLYGKEMNTKFYSVPKESVYASVSKHPFKTQSIDFIFSNSNEDFYSNIECTPDAKMKKNVVLNNDGVVIINSDEYKNIKQLCENYLIATTNEGLEMIIDSKGNKIQTEGLISINKLYTLDGKTFFEHDPANKKLRVALLQNNKLAFSPMIGFGLKDSLFVDELSTAYNKYFLVKAIDYKVRQYVCYIYDENGKFIMKDESGLYKFDTDGKILIKYLVGDKSKKDELYLTYLDENLKPYSIIKE
jgi:hypothetical protein